MSVTLQNLTWNWTPRREQAAVLLAVDDKTDAEIAAECKVTRQSIAEWKRAPEFQARIAEERQRFRESIFSTGFADKAKRVRALDVVAGAVLNQLQRAEFQTIVKVTDDGEHIYGFDRDRLREFREYLDDIAEEMGDRGGAAQPAVNVNVGVGVAVTLDPGERAQRISAILARLGAD